MKNACGITVLAGFLSLTAVFLSFLVKTAAIPYQCKEGVECLPLDRCTGLYRRWQGDRETYNYTIELLLCEKYEAAPNKLPKVCCAPKLFLTNDPLPAFKPVSRTQKITNDGRSAPTSTILKMPDEGESTVKPVSTTLKTPNEGRKSKDVQCGEQNVDRIIGGNRTHIDEYPWMALLKYEFNVTNGFGYYCGGVLLSSRYVLTAAHCVYTTLGAGWKLSHVILGEWDTSTKRDCDNDLCNEAIEVAIERAIVHDQYVRGDDSMPNDIALLRLAREVQFDDFVKPICLPTEAALLKNNFEGYDLQVAGWGKTNNASASQVKLKISLPVYDHKKCQDQYFRQGRNVTDKQFCVGGKARKDTCRGDSGGPLMGQVSFGKRWAVVGVTSYGPSPCGTEGWPGIYTRVTPYLKWIQDNMIP
ncbi:CLIP domain-containing serine protease 2-like [Aricia agestis]|uniref:CLIP domain-containing serine protease 2-like n=1 Tax=Aricia agestis TaxID=91739 RepID=UPI001C206FD6|nr:CLIP domain-containing serine protease 2-like [Aricia agestis]